MAATRILFIICIVSFLLAGCASKGEMQKIESTMPAKEVNAVSVMTFACPDALIAHNVRNAIINSLLGNYSVAIGKNADVVIKGSIKLLQDNGSSGNDDAASGASSGSNISEINAEIVKNETVIESFVITKSESGTSSTDSPEDMGKKTGAKIKEILSK